MKMPQLFIIILILFVSVHGDMMCPGSNEPSYDKYPMPDWCGGCQYCRNGNMCPECGIADVNVPTTQISRNFEICADGITHCNGCQYCPGGDKCPNWSSSYCDISAATDIAVAGVCPNGGSCSSNQICTDNGQQSLCSISPLLKNSCLNYISFTKPVVTNATEDSCATFNGNIGSYSLTACGYTNNVADVNQPGTASALYFKKQGGGEEGLGLLFEKDHEINNNGFIQIDVTRIQSATNANLVMGSTSNNEKYTFYGSNIHGVRGNIELFNSTKELQYFSFPELASGEYKYISVVGTVGNVLLSSFLSDCPVCIDTIFNTFLTDAVPYRDTRLNTNVKTFYASSAGESLTLTGWDKNAASQTELYAKYLTQTDSNQCDIGIGIYGDVNGKNEIGTLNMIQIDIRAYKSANKMSISMCSTEGNEYYRIYGSNIYGTQGETLLKESAVGVSYVELSNYHSFDYLSVTARNGDVLINSLKVCQHTPSTTGILRAAQSARTSWRKLNLRS